jgi:hypothetical protein
MLLRHAAFIALLLTGPVAAACGSEAPPLSETTPPSSSDAPTLAPDTAIEDPDITAATDGAASLPDAPDPSVDAAPAPDTAAPESDTASADTATPSEGPCPSGTTCEAGWCAQPRVTDQCVRDADCPGPGTWCNPEPVGGICLGCGGDEDCPDGFTCTDFGACAIACDVDDDCPTGECYAAQGLCGQRRCAADADCPTGTLCLDGGQCGRVSCPDPCAPNPCDAPNRRVCVAEGTEGHRCDCDPGYVLDTSGACVLPDTGPCTGGLTCLGGRCANPDAPGFQCAVDADCGGGRTCSAALPSGVCTGCADASDCPAGHDRCLAGRCLRACATNADCSDGMRCNNGVCGQLPCREAADCGPDHDCDLTAAEPRCIRRTCD